MDNLFIMKVDPHTFAEGFIPEDFFKSQARARGVELGTSDTTSGSGAFLRYLAFTLKAQSVVEVGTASGVGSLWLLKGMMKSGNMKNNPTNYAAAV